MDNAEEIQKTSERHIGKPQDIELELPDKKLTVKMSPLSIEQVIELYGTLTVLKGVDKDPTAIFQNINKEFITKISALAFNVIKPNHPEIPADELKEAITRNVLVIANALWERNLGMGSREIGEVKRQQAIERLRQRYESNRNNTESETKES